ncbi:hypothetical protein GLYMA_02G157002v4 [Glycine max]|nr:hypothetical protein GLYMA_02G157002v4 [Glycine max]
MTGSDQISFWITKSFNRCWFDCVDLGVSSLIYVHGRKRRLQFWGYSDRGKIAPSAYHMAPRSEAPSQVPPPVPEATVGAIGVSLPGPREHVLQCFIRRNNASQTYYMFLSLSSALVADDGKFLLAARKFRRPTCTDYIIFVDADDMSRESNASVGKLRSHHRTKTFFIIWRTYQLVISSSQLERVETT